MKNVSRVVYFPELDEIHSPLARKEKEKSVLTLEHIMTQLPMYIDAVLTTDNSEAILASCFTNAETRRNYYGRRYGVTLLVFPLYEEQEVKYQIKEGNFFINKGGDPLEIKESLESHQPDDYPPIVDRLLLFKQSLRKKVLPQEYIDSLMQVTIQKDPITFLNRFTSIQT